MMNINFDQHFLNHLTSWKNKTDDECINLATKKDNTLDAEQAMSNLIERDLCDDIYNEILIEFQKLRENK
jgi:hypothetical protein